MRQRKSKLGVEYYDNGMGADILLRSRLAKIKEHTARDLGKRSKPLGRKCSVSY